MSESYYHILGIPTDADEREIKRAYHRLARELHPDKAASPDKAREAEQRFAVISKAYNVLKDPDLRKDYDAKLPGARGGNGSQGQSPRATPTQSVMRPKTTPDPAATQVKPEETKRNAGESSPMITQVRSNKADVAGLNSQRASIAQKAFAKGVQLMKQKDFIKAIDFFQAAINNNPNEASYHAHLSMAMVNAKRSASKAIEYAERAIELDTYNIDYKMNLAQIYEMIGSKANAIKLYEEVLRWDEKNQVAQQMLRQLKKKEGFFNKMVDESPILTRLQGLFKREK